MADRVDDLASSWIPHGGCGFAYPELGREVRGSMGPGRLVSTPPLSTRSASQTRTTQPRSHR